MASSSSIRKKRNFKNLALTNPPVVQGSSAPSHADTKSLDDKQELSSHLKQLKQLEVGVEFKLDLRAEDLQVIQELGAGNGGTVSKVLHVPTQAVMARKNIHIETQPEVKKRILRELQILHECNSPNIVSFYGAFLNEGDVCVCMEYMDVGSLDTIYKKNGPFPVPVLRKITHGVLCGLVYLYDSHRIIHRDVKPSNILINSAGLVKICDFGVSGVLINSIANTFVGTSHYMSPERIMGGAYSVKSDVWSLGITLHELAIGRFPFPADNKSLAIFELLQYIVNEPVPEMPQDFPEDFRDFVKVCLMKDPKARPTPKELLDHPYIKKAAEEKVDMEAWAASVTNKGK